MSPSLLLFQHAAQMHMNVYTQNKNSFCCTLLAKETKSQP